MTIFLIGTSTKPSGGIKVLNQIVNLFIEKGYDSKFVLTEDYSHKNNFMENPAPTITLEELKINCKKEDIVINFWMKKSIHEFIKQCSAHLKIFWHHGIVIAKYPDFNGEESYNSKIYDQYWNVSKDCANYISKKYKIKNIKIISPFFDDETLLKYFNKRNDFRKEGILILRRRGQEIIPDIINRFPEQKITILNKTFSNKKLYSELIRHKYFVSTDKGITNKLLIKNKYKRIFLELIKKIKRHLMKKDKDKNSWLKQDKNLLGFPMSACESAWLGTNVIGFAMGGGLEWMNNNNMYLAKDGNAASLIEKINEAINDDENILERKKKLAFENVKKFNKKNIWEQLQTSLNIN